MQPEQIDQKMSRKRKSEEMGCCCLTEGDCELHDMTPLKRLNMMDEAIMKVHKLLDGQHNIIFSSEEYTTFFSCALRLSSRCYYNNYASLLYEKFIGAFTGSILTVVLPSLDGKDNVALVTEVLDIWARYKTMADWLLKLFDPMKTYCHITKGSQLTDIPFDLICDWVFDPLWSKLRDEVLRLVNLEREGRVVNRDLLKGAIDFFVEIQKKGRRNYYRDFEQVLIADTAACYRQSASGWFLSYSLGEYMKKALRCMRMEERRMKYYLPETTLVNLLQAVGCELME